MTGLKRLAFASCDAPVTPVVRLNLNATPCEIQLFVLYCTLHVVFSSQAVVAYNALTDSKILLSSVHSISGFTHFPSRLSYTMPYSRNQPRKEGVVWERPSPGPPAPIHHRTRLCTYH